MLSSVLKDWGAVEVSAMEFYTDVFKLGEGLLQCENEEPGSYKANPIAYWKNDGDDHGYFRIMFEDTFEETLKELQNADFSILNGSTYFGRRNLQSHVSKMYALPFDLDDVTDDTLTAFLSGSINGGAYPIPQYIVLSGHGVHLWYVFENPIPLFPNIKLQLKELKYALTDKIWNQYTSTAKKPQHQGINQGFRVIGGKTKKGAPELVVRAFRLNSHPTNLDQLSEFVPDAFKVDEDKLFKESKLSLSEAQKKYPDWYEKVVLNKDRVPKKWDIAGKVNGDNPYALYDWWKRQIKSGASYGKRYFNIMCLAIYGVKCDVPFEKVKEEAYELVPFLNALNPNEPFTEKDVDVALECYDERYCTFPRKDISKISGIYIEANKRNYQKQADHLEEARAIRDIRMKRQGKKWDENNGRKSAEIIVMLWCLEHPDGTKKQCKEQTGLSYPTIRKWWNSEG